MLTFRVLGRVRGARGTGLSPVGGIAVLTAGELVGGGAEVDGAHHLGAHQRALGDDPLQAHHLGQVLRNQGAWGHDVGAELPDEADMNRVVIADQVAGVQILDDLGAGVRARGER